MVTDGWSPDFRRDTGEILILWVVTIVGTVVGWWVGRRWLLPVFQTLPAYGYLYVLLKKGRFRKALVAMLNWSLALAVVMAMLVWQDPARGGEVILRGEWYRTEMFHWLCTGVGTESMPSRFIPMHLREIALFVVTSILTASLISMHGGAVLMNYMSYYVGSLMAHSERPLLVFFAAWKVYAVIRVISFVMLGVLLAEVVWSWIWKRPYIMAARKRWYYMAIIGLGLDILIKALTAPLYQKILVTLVHLPCGAG